jgi:TonB family protein
MSLTANEAPVAAQTPENPSDLSPSRRTDAVGAEIAVTIHASRYSAGARGAANKNLSPIHEETRTVIIFPTGAVVRLSASVTTGELVVLTNQQTGDDVICRVANVKAQPGIQNYVNLEFTQRAPNFWGDALPAERAVRPDPPAHSAVLAPVVIPPRPPAQPAPVAEERTLRGPVLVPAAELISAVQAVTDLLNAVPGSAATQLRSATPVQADPAPRGASPAPQAGPGAEQATARHTEAPKEAMMSPVIAPAPTPVHGAVPSAALPPLTKMPDARPSAAVLTFAGAKEEPKLNAAASSTPSGAVHSAVTQAPSSADPGLGPKLVSTFGSTPGFTTPLQSGTQEWVKPELSMDADLKSSGSKKILLIAAAAVVLLIVGGAGGAVLFRHSSPAQEQTVRLAPPLPPAPPLQGTTGTVLPAVTTSANMQPEAATARSAVAPAEPASESPSVKSDSSNAASSRRPSMALGKLSAPVAKAPSQMTSSEPPPELSAPASSLIDNSLLSGPARGSDLAVPDLPTASAHIGGQLKQPKLISSQPAAYPPLALRAKLQGVVVIDVLVDTSGKVASMKVISGLADLQQAAMEAVHNWKYEPAQLNGQPIAVHTRVSVNFHLQ